jgi:threonyl-tRNA synthetase
MKLDDGNYYLKAMNCPATHLIFKSEPRSYRDFPLRLAEYGTVYRNELSGTLAGLLRTRMLSMNDAHIYCLPHQIGSEFKAVIEMVLYYFKAFGLKEYWFRLSKWSQQNREKYIDEPKNWELCEAALRRALKTLKVKFVEAKNEAAFYGPKVDVQFKSVTGREETLSTIQLDFAAKKRFNLVYHDKDGKEKNDVFVIHRAPLSTHERFIALLIEHYAGAFPVWLAPVQIQLLSVSEKFNDYAQDVCEELRNLNIRVEIDDSAETLGKKIRNAELEKVPYMIVLGQKEKDGGAWQIRIRGDKRQKSMTKSEFIKIVLDEIKNKQ